MAEAEVSPCPVGVTAYIPADALTAINCVSHSVAFKFCMVGVFKFVQYTKYTTTY